LTTRLEIRPRRSTDFEALVELDMASARHHAAIDPEIYHLPDRAAVAEFLQRRLDELDGEILVAEVDGRVVGAVGAAVATAPDPGGVLRSVPTIDLGISVAEGWRGRGIGEALMRAAEAWAREQGIDRIILDLAVANDRARRFYERLGYRTYGLLMRRELDGADGPAAEGQS
jgi:GNAT superfamily N-acetyltransferase